jgi:hypothetical protein
VPSYEYWLLTNLKKYEKNLSDNELTKELKNAINNKKEAKKSKSNKSDSGYNKNNSNLFEELFKDNYKKILEEAISRCKKQDEHNKKFKAKDNNPSSQIYKMIEYIKDFLE